MSYTIKEVDSYLFRSSRPTPDQLRLWKQTSRIGAVLDLEGDAPDAAKSEKSFASTLGLDELYLDMSGIGRPTVGAIMEALQYIATNKRSGISTLVHCLHGVDRTGIVCAAYRIVYQGWPVEQAWAEAVKMGLHWYVYWWWKKSLIELKGGVS
jgi:protein tyrosine/serine phosphatase